MDPALSHTIGMAILALVALAILTSVGLVVAGVIFILRGRKKLGICLIAAGIVWMLPFLIRTLRGY